MTKLHESASQTAGPYVHIGCVPNFSGISGVYTQDVGAQMVNENTIGDRISITGTVFDGTGNALKDAMVEIWQADANGIHASGDPRGDPDLNFSGWGRKASDSETGVWRFDTIKPGPVPHGNDRMMAPHITFWVVARGINIGLHTRMYFPEEDAANADDPVLARIEHKNRISTLIATRESDGMYQFNIHLQGPQETVFFDV
ncbi:protocatechuate 3,4-dioxygenase subunit alpha [uncultured Roseobacter sp.]|uniref:protocatechuate 3,4-dioxygenase subunit alpha n=1 Tax=uncultured Roseobacter sp. TaxID=114847 RepID=UPI0026324985|nr:protocatechuate 3,4-dioxygenase subunit alpha [uncultured Roseobacter sp.]